MKKFKEFYEEKYGTYPGEVHEEVAVVTMRVFEAMAEYMDYITQHDKRR